MRKMLLSLLLPLSFSLPALAYSGPEVKEDCVAAEILLTGQKSTDIFHSVKSSRCITYLEGFVDGFDVADHLADRVGVRLNAICAPKGPENRIRLVRAVLAYLDRQPPFPKDQEIPASQVVGAALASSFTCKE